jgi:hypothetical protein
MATDVTVDVRTDGLQTSGATSLAWNATITGGLTNSVLVGCGTTGAGTARRITTFAWDAAGTPVAMTNLGFIEEPGLNCYAEIWLLKAPASGTKQVKITPAASCEITGGSASYQWVNQTTPWNAGSPQTATHSGGGATSSSLSVTSALHEMVISCLVENGGSATTAAAGQTIIHNENVGSSQHSGISSDAAGASGTVTMTYNAITIGNPFAHVGGSLQFDGGGGVAATSSPIFARGPRFSKPRRRLV